MAINGGTISVTLQGKDVGLSDLLKQIQTKMEVGIVSAKQYDAAMAQLDPVTKRNESALLSYASSLAKVAEKQGDVAGAQKIMAQALGQVTPNTTAANNALAQLQGTINRQEAAVEKSKLSFQGLSQSFQGLIGSYLVVTQVAQAFGAAIEAGNQLEKQEATFRALSGSAEKYAANMDIARAQQQRFGGSLQDNLEGLSGFVNLSNRTGVSLEKLAQTARGLAIIDPAQGFKGASIALKEFFSGDISSLARRFEIPRKILNDLNKIEDPTAKFAALNEQLAKMGITQELIAASANTTAVQFDKLKGSAADAFAALGQLLGGILQPAARGLTQEFNLLTGALNNLSSQGAQITNITGAFLQSSGSVEQFNAKIQDANKQLPFFAASFTQLSAAEFEFAKNLSAIGIGQGEIMARLQQLQPMLSGINDTFQTYGIKVKESQENLNAFQVAALGAASVNAEGAQVAQNYAIAVGEGSLSIERATELLGVYISASEQTNQSQAAVAETTQQVITLTNLYSDELQDNILKSTDAAIASEALKSRQEALMAAALAAAQGMGVTAGAAAQLAGQFQITTGEAFNLISALQQLEIQKARDSGKVGQNTPISTVYGSNENFLKLQKQNEERAKIAKIEHDNQVALADTAGKIKLKKADLKDLTEGTVEYAQAQADLKLLEKQLADEEERRRKKKGGGAKLTPNEKINNSLLTDMERFNNKEEEAERQHLKKIEDINREHLQKIAEQIQQNEVSKRRSRASFYAGLTSAEGVDTSVFASAYEQAFAKAQEIAQSGSAKLADDFLKLKQQHIQELLDLEQQAANIKTDDKLSEHDKAAALEFLEGRKKLVQDAQAEEEKQLLESGDTINNETKKRLDEEAAAYEEQTTKIGIAANNAAEIKINQAERSKKSVSDENKELAKQVGLYKDVSDAADRSPASKRQQANQNVASPNTGDTQPISAPDPLPITPSAPIPVVSPQALLVQQNGIWLMRDQGVIDVLTDQTIRLEAKLQQVNDTIVTGVAGLNDRLADIRNTLGNMRPSTAL